MKKINTNSIVMALALAFALSIAGPIAAQAAASPSLGTAGTFGVLSGTFTNSNTAPQTIINGDVCYTTGPSTIPLAITGATITPCDPQTGLDQATALASLNSQACTDLGGGPIALDSVIIGANPPGTFPPGCYSTAGAMNITLGATVTLNGTGAYIFRSGGALTTGANSDVVLTNGADAADVFWAPAAATTLGANAALSATPTFVGNILDPAGISIGQFANLAGSALAFGGTVTTNANTITVPTPSTLATLNVVKLVVNANGGTAIASNFMVHVTTASTTLDVSGSPLPGAGAPGTPYSLSPGTYSVSEGAHAGYTQTFTGTCDANGNITLIAGQAATCTIVNTDIPAPVAPAPAVSSGGGGGVLVPLIGITKVPTPLALASGPGPVTYTYTVWNVGGQEPLNGVTVTDDKCSPVTLLSGDTNNNGSLDPGEKWIYGCSTTLANTTTNTAIATGHNGSQTAIATAIATVVVTPPATVVPGLPNTGLPPDPIISIVKVPSRLTPFPYGGGEVTYSYTVTNPGVVPMHNVRIIDNDCGPVSYISGDTNGNNLLDPGEVWSYTCSTKIAVSTRNTATVEGTGNGITALDYAFATVLVDAPGLPNTGYPPENNNAFIVLITTLAGISAVSFGIYLVRKKQAA